jgi:hypothetical protein
MFEVGVLVPAFCSEMSGHYSSLGRPSLAEVKGLSTTKPRRAPGPHARRKATDFRPGYGRATRDASSRWERALLAISARDPVRHELLTADDEHHRLSGRGKLHL